MRHSGSLVGGAALLRRFSIGATVIRGQIVCMDNQSKYADVGAPATVNDYTEAVGVTTEAGTYTATQGTGTSSADILVECQFGPFAIYRGRCSNGTVAGVALAEGTDQQLLTNTSASSGGIVITDADVGTSDFIYGYAVALTGQNAGQVRSITSHSDNTSETVTVPFDYAIAVGDTFVRTFGKFNQGVELTTNYAEFNMKPGAGVDLPDTGSGIVVDVFIDSQPRGKRDGRYSITNATAPFVEIDIIFADSAFNSVA